MKTIPFSDRLNPVFVKELRQSIHDRSIVFFFALLTAGQLILWYIRAIDPTVVQEADLLYHFGFSGAMLLLLLQQIHSAIRSGNESGKEGFDPSCGTGYPPWKIVLGKTAASWCITGIFLALFLPGICLLGKTFPARELVVLLPIFFLTGQLTQCCCMFSQTKSYRSLLALILSLWAIGATISVLSAEGNDAWAETLPLCAGGILLGLWFVCIQIANLMPERSDRNILSKIALLITGGYFASCSYAGRIAIDPDNIFCIAGSLFLIGALFERKEPTRRQIRQAPENILLRVLTFFVTSGCVPALATGTALLATGLYFNPSPAELHNTLICIFYVQLAVHLSGLCRMSAVSLWIFITILLNIPVISGGIFPWGAAFSLGAPEYLDKQTTIVIAVIAWGVSIVLNGQLFLRFVRLYFGRKAEQ